MLVQLTVPFHHFPIMLSFQALMLSWLLSATTAGFIDMNTPLDKRTTTSLVDGSTYHLVMSDEFNTPNRTFTDGHDPMWTALDKSDDDSSSVGGGSQQFYNSSFVTTTEDGMLKISTKIGKTTWQRYDLVKKQWKREESYFNSGMVQSWEKFCFTGGIVEVDVILPGDPFIGGLWPAIWMLGNLGRATYESSTNNVWPWSFNTCDRKLQPAQTISACNSQNHFGMHPFQGRGATEIDLIEIMMGDSNGPLPSTNPPIELPYADMTLQVAPGITKNRPQPGAPPLYEEKLAPNGHTVFLANDWYDGLKLGGNTSINPFFYGTYLAETKPGEPVTRTKKQAFQADAVGAAHQLTPAHFNVPHTFRVEWQPGTGGRIDWFSKGHRINSTLSMEGDGMGDDWVHVYSISDELLKKTTGAQIPIEPSYLIFNIAVSSTWGFPYDTPESCKKCYDCDDPKCSCTFAPGFCKMLRETDVALLIDSVRVYQTSNPSAHTGGNHTLGCDPVDYPTREWIKGHSYRYMRNPPFSYDDRGHYLKKIQKGGGSCRSHDDCGSHIHDVNLTKVFEEEEASQRRVNNEHSDVHGGRGICVHRSKFGGPFFIANNADYVCRCNPGYTGPQCLAQEYRDDTESAYENEMSASLFRSIPNFLFPPFMTVAVIGLFSLSLAFGYLVVKEKKAKNNDWYKI
jgi:beta-glucan synthesis-associated protein KRE6